MKEQKRLKVITEVDAGRLSGRVAAGLNRPSQNQKRLENLTSQLLITLGGVTLLQ